MTGAQQPEGRRRLPTLDVENVKVQNEEEDGDELVTPRAHRPHQHLPTISRNLPTGANPRPSSLKRPVSDIELSGSEPETHSTMSSKSSKHHSESGSSSKKHGSSKSKSKTSKSDDWTDVTEPDERRRIQNRIAQRKFREKARENKERAERDALNQEHAGRSYRIPTAGDLGDEPESEAGLPWGSFSMKHVVARGHEAESRRSSGRGDYIRDDSQNLSPNLLSPPQFASYRQPPSYGSSGGDDPYPEDDLYYYDYDYDYDQAGNHQQQKIGEFGYTGLLPGTSAAPADPYQPYDTASPGSSSASSHGYQGLHGL